MSRRTVVGAVALLLALAVTPDIAAWLMGHNEANRLNLYAVRQSIRAGMSRRDLEGLVRRIDDHSLGVRWESRDQLLIWAPTGFTKAYTLTVTLHDDQVIHAVLLPDDVAKGLPKDAPRDF